MAELESTIQVKDLTVSPTVSSLASGLLKQILLVALLLIGDERALNL